MHPVFATAPAASAIPITFATKATWEAISTGIPGEPRRFALANAFTAKPGAYLALPGADGKIAQIIFGLDDESSRHCDPFRPGQLPGLLPPGVYRFANAPHDTRLATLAFALGSYRFSRYRKSEMPDVRLVPSDGVDVAAISRMADATTLARDLINTPSNDMGPEELALAAQQLAERFGAGFNCIVGEDLRRQNFPLVHAVGMASPRAPRLIDLTWGDPADPKITLVGKGVCFDTGGLDLKPSSGMLLMKKDMGGAAPVLGVARMIMMAGPPIRLAGPIPAVENSVSGNAFRPLDVLATRKGLSVEVGNTDAEGRLILCDALAEAASDNPDLIIDFATLTGAARVALGTELPALFCNDDALADGLLKSAEAQANPRWRLPLHQPYAKMLESKVADLNNVGSGSFAGAILAALFLERFVEKATPWAHLDVMAWNPSSKPGRPEGGEALGMRAVYSYLESRYGKST